MGAGRGNAIEISLVEPNAMAEGQSRPQKSEAVDIVERSAAAAPAGIFFLIGGLDEVHVHRSVVSPRVIGEHLERGVGAPMKIGGSELDLDPLLVVMLGVEMFEQGAIIRERDLETRKMALQRRPQLRRHARGKRL